MRKFLGQTSSLTVLVATLLAQGTGALADDESKKPLTFTDYQKSVQRVDISKHKMTLETFKTSIKKKDTYLLDLREKDRYEQGRIKGALHIGPDVTAEKLAKLVPDKNATIVVYCDNTLIPTRKISLTFAILPQILALGYPNTFVLEEVYLNQKQGDEPFTSGPYWDKGETQPRSNEPKSQKK
jgi:hypothetical protein